MRLSPFIEPKTSPRNPHLGRRGAALLLGLSLTACGDLGSGAANRDAAAWGLSGGRALGPLQVGTRLALPLTSRSRVVPRALIQNPPSGSEAPGEVFFEVLAPGSVGGRVRWHIVAHAAEQQVLLTDSGWTLVGPPILPRSIEPQASTLLARQDGTSTSGSLEVVPPPSAPGSTSWMVIVSGSQVESTLQHGGQTWVLPPAPRGALVLPLEGSGPLSVTASSAVDQIYFCKKATPVNQLDPWATKAFDGGHLTIPVPTDFRGQETMTLLLEVLEAPLGLREKPRKAGDVPQPFLVDVATEAGIRMVHLEGPDLQVDIRPTMGPGAAWGDFDGDGWMDLFLPQGSGRPEQDPLPHRLFRNLGTGSFEDISSNAGLGGGDASMGALAWDANGDGHLDLYLACRGKDRLFLGRGDGTFSDASELLPPSDQWSASASAADYDGDGDLDLYVTRYLEFDLSLLPPESEIQGMGREDPLPMLPYLFTGQVNQLLRNDLEQGVLSFTDVASDLRVHDPKTRAVGTQEQQAPGLGMQAIWWDFDRDGDQDLYVANDVTPNVLYENTGGAFTEVTLEAGLDDPRGGMGLAVGDVDRDGDEDLFLTNWELESNALYLNLLERRFTGRSRRPRFRDGAIPMGLARPSMGVTSWAPVLFDLELDGDLDLFVANGYTSPDYASTGICLGQPDHLFLSHKGAFTESSATALDQKSFPCASRGAIACDYDQDGDEDILVTANNGAVRLLRNDAPRATGHTSIRIRLAGSAANTQGIGAEVTVHTPQGLFRRTLRAGEGYLTGGPAELLFGLGNCSGPIRATVRWPSGKETEHPGLQPGGMILLKED